MRFPREKRTFSVSGGPSARLHEVHTALTAPLFDQSKQPVFSGKYACHINSVLSGSSYLQKNHLFSSPKCLQKCLTPPKSFCRPPHLPRWSLVLGHLCFRYSEPLYNTSRCSTSVPLPHHATTSPEKRPAASS